MALVYSQMIYQFALVYQQGQAKREMKQQLRLRISEADLEMISYLENEKDIEWEEEGKEFRLHGEMYDVVKTATVNGKPVFYCINDKKENELIHKYLNLIKQKNNSDKKPRTLSIKLLFNQSSEPIFVSNQLAVVYDTELVCCLPNAELDQLIPPPKV
ncbi:hypothetical protein [Flavisolibacter tropicus]|uniref:Uncharacterized protein n=1 Tax=Flavisolibacter tropicus TaxID=1492898 RepID=A0A172TR04_9BACT|nr:hypothetical protein [Flavisolibacter tropicus]ANE49183.1 hypothetical protein SY85_00360 [Flavisolibacter tropicus]